MEEGIPTVANTSTRFLAWLLAYCEKERIDKASILRTTGLTLNKVQNRHEFITWPQFSTALSNLSLYWKPEDFAEAGRHAWRHRDLAVMQQLATNLYDVGGTYHYVFGSQGLLAKMTPCYFECQRHGKGDLRIFANIPPHLDESGEFLHLLQGMIVSLWGQQVMTLAARVTPRSAEYRLGFPSTYTATVDRLRRLQRHGRFLAANKALAESTEARLQLTRELFREKHLHAATRADLAASLSNLTEMMHHLKIGNVLVNDQLDVIQMSPNFPALTNTQISGQRAPDLHTCLDSASVSRLENIVLPLADRQMAVLEPFVSLRNPLGETFHFLVLAINESHSSGEQRYQLILASREEQAALERALTQLQARYNDLSEATPLGLLVTDELNVISSGNLAVTRLTGLEESQLRGLSLNTLFQPMTTAKANKLGLSDEQLNSPLYEIALGPAQGTPVSILEARSDNIQHTDLILLISDLSEKVTRVREDAELARHLRATSQMALARTFAEAGALITDHVTRRISEITGLPQEAQRQTATQTGLQEKIHTLSRMISQLATNQAEFLRGDHDAGQAFDLNERISSLRPVLEALVPDAVSLRCYTSTDPAWITGYSPTADLLILLLALACKEHLPAGSVIRLTTETKTTVAGAAGSAEILLIMTTEPNEQSDNDNPEKQIRSLLSLAEELASLLNGTLAASSTNRGWRLTLPCEPLSRQLQVNRASNLTYQPEPDTRGTVLIIEDSNYVRDLARLVLRGLGYQVIEAADGQLGLEIFLRQADAIDLVILDIVLPVMGGQEVMRRILDVAPDTHILFTSGYSTEARHNQFIAGSGFPFLRKPFTTDALLNKINALLPLA
ncbi:MAG: response regulator [Pseudomonadales bacterium]|nr:response regulator [Pseudomonadales bacterium]